MTRNLSLIAALVFLSSCSNFVTRKEIQSSGTASNQPASSPISPTKPKVVIKEVVRVENKYVKIKSDSFDEIDDLELNYKQKHYDFWLKYFSKREKARFLRHARNGAKYRTVITKILESHGLPKDLFYVGLIESGYNARIRSHASAVGPWQFIKGTATRYGLRVDSYVDERTHIIKATEAAASYFKDLYNIFGSWELALCAYNAGEYRIINAIRKGNTRDYKALVKKKLIPRETIFYVPKVAAASELYRAPKKYGLNLPEVNKSLFESVKPVKLTRSFNMRKKAKKLGLSYVTLKALNPDLKKGWVKVKRRRSQSIFIPSSDQTDFSVLANAERKRIKRIARVKKKTRKVSSVSRKGRSYHRVRRGENLSLISKKYNITINTLKRYNGLRSSKIKIGQKLALRNSKRARYKVKKGDNLSAISRKFGVTISSLKRKNRLRNDMVYYGQVLKIPSKG